MVFTCGLYCEKTYPFHKTGLTLSKYQNTECANNFYSVVLVNNQSNAGMFCLLKRVFSNDLNGFVTVVVSCGCNVRAVGVGAPLSPSPVTPPRPTADQSQPTRMSNSVVKVVVVHFDSACVIA